jgi:hypothetical protein
LLEELLTYSDRALPKPDTGLAGSGCDFYSMLECFGASKARSDCFDHPGWGWRQRPIPKGELDAAVNPNRGRQIMSGMMQIMIFRPQYSKNEDFGVCNRDGPMRQYHF